jgi:hypothetical protein
MSGSIGRSKPKHFVYYPELWRTIKKYTQRPEVIVEIGTWRGHWVRQLTEHIPDFGRCFCIDPWAHKQNGAFSYNAPRWANQLGSYAFTRIFPLRGTSVEWASVFNLPIDLLYVDGWHDYRNVMQDLEGWFPKLCVGGLVLIHDCENCRVNQAVEDFFAERPEELLEGKFGPPPRHRSVEVLTKYTQKLR